MNATVSIIIPTYNAGEFLDAVLQSVYSQTLSPLEVIIIDSSSTDNTSEIAIRWPVEFWTIRKEDFNHGATRNMGAAKAMGDCVVFLTQDAVPRDDKWLEGLIGPLSCGETVGSFSRQIPRLEAVPMERFFYRKMYPETAVDIDKDNVHQQDTVFSNASSAIIRSFLLEHPFAEDILMSEDREWGLRVVRDGFVVRYEADSQVVHSHGTTFTELFRRYFDFGVSHAEIKGKQESSSYFSKGLTAVFAEFKFLVQEGQSAWIPRSICYNGAKFLGLAMGHTHRLLPRGLKRRFTTYYAEYWS